MDDVNPIVITLMFIARCLVPLLVMLGVSYLLRRFGWIKEPPPPPQNWEGDEDNSEGGLAHG